VIGKDKKAFQDFSVWTNFPSTLTFHPSLYGIEVIINLLNNAKDALNLKKIEELVSKYYYLALILIEEDKKLSRKMMPENWNREDFYSRYEKAGIDLINNPLYEGLE